MNNDTLENEFWTSNDCNFSIFHCDQNEDSIHIEINPNVIWNKEDVWELIAELLISVGELDKEGKVLFETMKSEKKLLVLTTPTTISDEQLNYLKTYAKETLKSANIDAEPLILSDGLKAEFIY